MNFGTKYSFFGPKRANWDHLGSNMADNWFADQLIWSVGLGARAVSRTTPIYFILMKNKHNAHKTLTPNTYMGHAMLQD